MGGLPRALVPIYAIVFIDVLGLTILIPMLPALAKKLDTTPAVMGSAIAVTAVCATISSPLWGALSDRIGRKRVLQISQAFSFVGYASLALAGNVGWLFASRAIEGFGGGNLGVAQSFVADVTGEGQREKAFAYGAAAFGAGFVIGPVMAGQLLRLGTSVPFWVAAGLQAANFVLTAIFLEQTGARVRGPAPREEARALAADLRTRAMLNLLGRQFLYIFSFTYFFTIFALYLKRDLHVGASDASLFLGLAGLIGAATQVVAVERLDRAFGDYALSQGAFAVGCVAYAAMIFIGTNLATFVAFLVLWAISGSLLRPTLTKLLAAAAPPDRRGAILGFADSLSNASMIVAPVVGGIVVDAAPRAIGLLPAACLAAAFGLGLAARGREPARVS